MGVSILYIIGNGFDLHHGMKSRYWDFKEYVESNNPDLLEQLEEYFECDSLWSDFEETLAYLDTERIVDGCMNYLEPYSAEKWSDAFHHDYQYEMQQRIDLITVELTNLFTAWVLQLRLPESANTKGIEIKRDGVFLCFNYTNTLEELYGVRAKNILYIHNKAETKDSNLILGHSRNPDENKKLEESYYEDMDVRVAEGNKILDNYFKDTYKATPVILRDYHSFFKSLGSITEIYVLGHSISKVDQPYFQEVINNIDKTKAQWKISIHNKKELVHHKEIMAQLGIDMDLIEFGRIDSFGTKQLRIFPSEGF